MEEIYPTLLPQRKRLPYKHLDAVAVDGEMFRGNFFSSPLPIPQWVLSGDF
jgi:hypothetical protein